VEYLLWMGGGVSGGGVWGCLNGTSGSVVAVRSIVDFQAIGNLLTLEDGQDGEGGRLPQPVQRAMADFFVRELSNCGAKCTKGAVTPNSSALGSTDWPIALSRRDMLRFVDRPDHGTTGSYAAWPPLAAQALAELDGDFERATPFFLGTASAARLGPFGQANAVQVVTTPGYGPHDPADPHGAFGVAAFKTTRGADRYTALAGGAWADVIVRSFFGWRPRVSGGHDQPWRPQLGRGVTGELLNVRVQSGGLVNITLSAHGPSYQYQ
jgi:hypothetical protein